MGGSRNTSAVTTSHPRTFMARLPPVSPVARWGARVPSRNSRRLKVWERQAIIETCNDSPDYSSVGDLHELNDCRDSANLRNGNGQNGQSVQRPFLAGPPRSRK